MWCYRNLVESRIDARREMQHDPHVLVGVVIKILSPPSRGYWMSLELVHHEMHQKQQTRIIIPG